MVGVYNEGFVHAGNLAYLTLLSLFPFFIVIAASAQVYGGIEGTKAAIHTISLALPASVGALVKSTGEQVVGIRTGPLLWFGAAVGVWTVGSYIETIREILRGAYGTEYGRPFWQYRLVGMAMIFGAVVLLLLAFSAQILMTTADELLVRFFPAAGSLAERIGDTRFIPLVLTFFASYAVFLALAPTRYRGWGFPKWPGALVTTLWWYLAVTLLPRALDQFGGYTLTYGGLAGVMVALLFFWLVGYGLVIGAHVNAALANPEQTALKAETTIE